ncbi:MAG: methyltransferase domain-containing protein [Patescibacteria group bacterium]
MAQLQVNKDHYSFIKYNQPDTWMNFWYQVFYVLSLKPKTVLEIGPGNKTVTEALKKNNVQVTTIDIDSSLNPDIVASVAELPFQEKSFDLVLCCEVLEHLPYDLFKDSLKEIKRVCRHQAVLCLPNAGIVFSFCFKLPLIKSKNIFFKVPFFWRKHVFNGQHYWETGKKSYSISRIKKDIISVGFDIIKTAVHPDDPAHYFFILK